MVKKLGIVSVLLMVLGAGCVKDTEPPEVYITNPANGATVNGTVNITAEATDNKGVEKVEFYIDGILVYTSTSKPYSYSWTTTSLPDSSYHSIYAKAYDKAGNEGTSSPISVMVYNGGGGGTLIWEEDFESYSAGSFPSTWTPDGNATDNSTNYVDNSVYYDGTKSLRLYGVIGGCWGALAYRPLTVSPPFEIEVAVRNGDESLSGCHPDRAGIALRKGTSWTNPSRGLVRFEQDGTIKSGGGGVSLGTYTTLTWYVIKVRYERPSASDVKISYWINGEYKGYETLPADSVEDQKTNLQLAVDEGTVWYDAVKVFH